MDADGKCCSCVPRESFQPRLMLDQLIFFDGWIARACLNRTAWLTVRAVAPYEAGILSLFVVLRETRRDRNKPLQLHDMLQELIFMDGGAAQRWLTKPELLAARAVVVCKHRLLPSFCILEKLGDQLRCGGDVEMLQCTILS